MPQVKDPALLAQLNAGNGDMVRPADPKIPGQLTSQSLSNQKAAADIQAIPLDREGKGLNNAGAAQQNNFRPVTMAADLSNQFAKDSRVASYRNSLPNIVSAMGAGDNATGDLTVVYSWAKAMDPEGSVREGDTEMAKSASSYVQRAVAMAKSVNEGNRLPKEIRDGLIREARNKGHQLNLAFSEARKQYGGLAKQAGLDPETIIGAHDGGKYQSVEANYKGAPVTNLDGSQGAAPDPDRWRTVTDKEIRDFIIENQGMDQGAMAEYAKFKLGRSIDNLPEVVDRLRMDGAISGIVNRSEGLKPEIMGLLEGGKHVWDRAAQGLQGGVNALTGSDFQSADRAAQTSQDYFAQQGTDPTFNAIGRIGMGAAMSAPFGGPMMQGALSGVLMGDSNTPLGVAGEAAGGAAGGWLGNKLISGGARLLGAEVDPAAKRLVQEGAKLTPGRIFPSLRMAEDLGDTLPFAGPKIRAAQDATKESINRIPANRSLAPIGGALPDNVPAGHGAVDYAGSQLGDFYNKTLAGKTIGLDPTFSTRLNAIGQRSGLRPQELGDLSDIVTRELGGAFQAGPELGKMSGRTFRDSKERLSDIANSFAQNKDDPFKRQEGQVLGDIIDQFSALARRQSPEMAKGLRAADEGWANFARLRAAAAMSPADGLANPGQFRTAARQLDKSVGKGATARGEALMQDFASDASKIIPSDFGNSGTSPREAFSQFRPWAFAKGAALSPLWSEPSVNLLNLLAGREAGPLAQLTAKGLRKIPAGPLGGLLPWMVEPGK